MGDDGAVVGGEYLVSGGQAAEAFELVEAAFDDVAAHAHRRPVHRPDRVVVHLDVRQRPGPRSRLRSSGGAAGRASATAQCVRARPASKPAAHSPSSSRDSPCLTPAAPPVDVSPYDRDSLAEAGCVVGAITAARHRCSDRGGTCARGPLALA